MVRAIENSTFLLKTLFHLFSVVSISPEGFLRSKVYRIKPASSSMEEKNVPVNAQHPNKVELNC